MIVPVEPQRSALEGDQTVLLVQAVDLILVQRDGIGLCRLQKGAQMAWVPSRLFAAQLLYQLLPLAVWDDYICGALLKDLKQRSGQPKRLAEKIGLILSTIAVQRQE